MSGDEKTREFWRRNEEYLDRCKSRLRMASPERRWDIVCEPHHSNDCTILEAYALTLPGGIVRPSFNKEVDHDE